MAHGWENKAEATTLPVPGRFYIVGGIKAGEGLSHMAAAAYGNGKRWREIWKPNKKIARSSDPNRSFWPGDVVWIPGDYIEKKETEELREEVAEELPDADANGIQLIIDGVLVPVVSGQVLVTFDTAADGWVATVPWNPELEAQRRLFNPYGYQSAECYVGGKLLCRGWLYRISPSFGPDGRTLRLEGWSLTADLVDSTIRPPYERNKVTLQKRAEELCTGIGIGVVWEAGDDPPFDRVTATEGQPILDHLGDLANQRGVQLSCTSQGDLLFHKAAAAAPVDAFIEGSPPLMEGKCTFDGRTRFASYTARGQSPGKTTAQATANDSAVPAHRILSFTADESAGSDMQKAADWRRAKAFGESMILEVPVNSWYDRDGNLWKPGTTIAVMAPSLFLEKGFDFLVTKVEFNLSEEGADSVVTLTPPQVYTGEELPDPWYEAADGEEVAT
jgi:prophage tail gpP-like protein